MPKSKKIPTVRFNLKSRKSTTDAILIVAVFRYHDQRLVYSTREWVLPKYWDQKAQRAKHTIHHPEYSQLNKNLRRIETMIIDIYCDHGYQPLERSEFKRLLDIRLQRAKKAGVENKSNRKSLFEFIEDRINESMESPSGARGTWRKWRTCLNHLKAYADAKDIELDFHHIDWDFRHAFINWLYQTKNHSINHVAKLFQTLSQFLREAAKRGYTDISVYAQPGWNVRQVKIKKYALTWEELDELYSLSLSHNPRLERVRDLFLIGAYTGLRFSDFIRIRPEHLFSEDGIEMLEIRTVKTGTEVVIPLLPQLKEILLKYSFRPPKISNGKLNAYLKEVAELAGWTDHLPFVDSSGGVVHEVMKRKCDAISSHWARRSWASNFYKIGIPAASLMLVTGHATEAQFFQYICIDRRENAKELAKQIAAKMHQLGANSA